MRFLLVLLVLLAPPCNLGECAVASAKASPPLWKLYRFPCKLELAPSYSAQFEEGPYLRICGHAKAQTDALLLSRSPRQAYAHESSLYLAAHYELRHALHWRGRLRIPSRDGKKPAPAERENLEAVYQFGKTALDQFAVSVGRQALPFGLNLAPFDGFFALWEPRSFWPSPEKALVASLDDGLRFTAQIGAALSRAQAAASQPAASIDGSALSSRLMYELPALQGTRLIASAYGKFQGESRIGLALLHRTPHASLAQIEWIRTFSGRATAGARPFSQLIRIAIVGPRSQTGQTAFLYDDILDDYRLATLAHSYFIIPSLSARAGLLYRKDERLHTYAWGFLLGFGAEL